MFPRVYGMVWYRLITRQFKICVVSVWIDYSFGAELTVLRRHTCQTNFPHFTLAEKLCIVSLVYNITSWMRSHNFGIKFLASWIFYRFPFVFLSWYSSWVCITWKTLSAFANRIPGLLIFATKLFNSCTHQILDIVTTSAALDLFRQ